MAALRPNCPRPHISVDVVGSIGPAGLDARSPPLRSRNAAGFVPAEIARLDCASRLVPFPLFTSPRRITVNYVGARSACRVDTHVTKEPAPQVTQVASSSPDAVYHSTYIEPTENCWSDEAELPTGTFDALGPHVWPPVEVKSTFRVRHFTQKASCHESACVYNASATVHASSRQS